MKILKTRFKYLIIALVTMILFQSCSTYKQQVETDSGTEIKKIKLHNIWVFKSDKSKVKGILYSADLEGITIAKDKKFNENEFITVNPSDIKVIKINKKGHLGKSALIGAAVGAGSGAIFGLMGGDDDDDGLFSMTKEDKAIALGAVFGVVGTSVGLIIGTKKNKIKIDGDQVKYESYLGAIKSSSAVWEH